MNPWGGWELFQHLLAILKGIAEKYGVSISNVAVRHILDRPTVAGVIIGARLGIADHHDQNAKVFDFSMDDEDVAQIHSVTSRGRDLHQIIGDCGDEYRR